MNKSEARSAIIHADISKDGWIYDILDKIEDRYAAGYLTRRMEELGRSIAFDTEEFRDEMWSTSEWNIWDK